MKNTKKDLENLEKTLKNAPKIAGNPVYTIYNWWSYIYIIYPQKKLYNFGTGKRFNIFEGRCSSGTMFWCGFSCKKVRYRTSNFAKKCGTGAVKMTKSAVMERQKYSVLTTYIRQVTSPCLAFLGATGDAAVDDTGLQG